MPYCMPPPNLNVCRPFVQVRLSWNCQRSCVKPSISPPSSAPNPVAQSIVVRAIDLHLRPEAVALSVEGVVAVVRDGQFVQH